MFKTVIFHAIPSNSILHIFVVPGCLLVLNRKDELDRAYIPTPKNGMWVAIALDIVERVCVGIKSSL